MVTFTLSAPAIRITDADSGAVLFDNNGFENDTVGIKPIKTITGAISGKEQDKIAGSESTGPGAFQGYQYAYTSRDQNGAGNVEAKITKSMTEKGRTVLIEWAWYLPANSNAKWGLKGNTQFYKSLWRAGNGSFQVYIDGRWEYRGYYTVDKWFECSLKYTIGDPTADLTVDGMKIRLEVDNYLTGAPGVQGIYFSHNVQAGYYLDGISK